MRGANANDASAATINAAATAIAAEEDRQNQTSSVQKKRWTSCWSITACFGSHKPSTKIWHAPEPNSSRTEAPMVQIRSQAPSFTAPPSSPASFIQSEVPSATQSPNSFLSFTSTSAAMYSPTNPANMFAVGPYAHETQLVSPPAFSTYTTEPSTAPFTPPPESVHLTTPSSPEVPFAWLLANQNGEVSQKFSSSHYEFQSYQLYPGSPMGHLISPSSGTSSPLGGGGLHFIQYPIRAQLSPQDQESGDGYERRKGEKHHKLSFEITPEEIAKCVERWRSADKANGDDVEERCDGKHHESSRGSDDEFNFKGVKSANPEWWASEEIVEQESAPAKNWAFFPIMQPGVS